MLTCVSSCVFQAFCYLPLWGNGACLYPSRSIEQHRPVITEQPHLHHAPNWAHLTEFIQPFMFWPHTRTHTSQATEAFIMVQDVTPPPPVLPSQQARSSVAPVHLNMDDRLTVGLQGCSRYTNAENHAACFHPPSVELFLDFPCPSSEESASNKSGWDVPEWEMTPSPAAGSVRQWEEQSSSCRRGRVHVFTCTWLES